jgi:catechol 2,3-dioxygenase-like lactoylglutathione lyase family enzyme
MGPPEVARLHPPGSEFTVRLVQCQQPATDSGSTPYAEANHLGIYRMAFLVEDVRASCEELQNQGVACPPAVFLDMGPEIPVDGVWAAFFPDPDGSCLELIEMPKLTE